MNTSNSEQANVRVSREPDARLFSQVTRGTHLAVVTDQGDHWGVLMVNNTIGWVPKANLELIKYQTEISVPDDPLSAEPEAGLGAARVDLSPRIQSLFREAFEYRGTKYAVGGATKRGIDAGYVVKTVFATQGVFLTSNPSEQARVGQPIQGPDLQPGDRLYFDMKHVGRVSHTVIYIGNGYFIHASEERRKVVVDSIFKPDYLSALVGARRDL